MVYSEVQTAKRILAGARALMEAGHPKAVALEWMRIGMRAHRILCLTDSSALAKERNRQTALTVGRSGRLNPFWRKIDRIIDAEPDGCPESYFARAKELFGVDKDGKLKTSKGRSIKEESFISKIKLLIARKKRKDVKS